MDPPARVDPDGVGTHEVVAGRYRLDRSLGTSRMAEVFVATDLQLRRSVAVKRLPSSAMEDATAKARFAREARALARVNNPNVVTVFDIVVDDGRPFLIMELVDGVTLRHLIDAEGRLDPARVVSIAAEICSGLAAVHACEIVHRDMKPSNVFLTTSGAVKIGDFGIASVASDVTLTRAGEVFGSAPYVSPEQVTGDPVDARADLYALGCVMFEMATGRPPFVGDDPAALAYQQVHAAPERADALVPHVPAALASTIDRLMAKDPADRPASADALRRSLETMPLSAASGVARRPHATVGATGVDRRPAGDPAAVASAPDPALAVPAPMDRRAGHRDRPAAHPQRALRRGRPRGPGADAGHATITLAERRPHRPPPLRPRHRRLRRPPQDRSRELRPRSSVSSTSWDRRGPLTSTSPGISSTVSTRS